MKKIIFILSALIVFSLTSYTQQFFVGGNISISNEAEKIKGDNISIDRKKYFYFNFMPKGGYFINNNIAIGGTIGFSYDVEKETNSDRKKNSMFYIGPLARYYYKPIENAGIFFEGLATFGFGSNKIEDIQGNTTIITKKDLGSFNIGIIPGVFIGVTKNLLLEFAAGWIVFSNEYIKSNDTKEITNNFDFILNSVLQFGITYNF